MDKVILPLPFEDHVHQEAKTDDEKNEWGEERQVEHENNDGWVDDSSQQERYGVHQCHVVRMILFQTIENSWVSRVQDDSALKVYSSFGLNYEFHLPRCLHKIFFVLDSIWLISFLFLN